MNQQTKIKEQYDKFVQSSPQGTLFCTSWWLDAVAPANHRILTVERGENLQAAWPIFFHRSRLGGLVITSPPLTPWLGVLYRPFTSKLARELSEQKKLASLLIAQLPAYDSLHARCHRNFEYWSPFYWQGFAQTTRYTYLLDNLEDLDTIWEGLRHNIRTDIRKAQRVGLGVEQSSDVDAFWRIHAQTFGRQGLSVPYAADYVRRIDQTCAAHGARKIFIARDRRGHVHAGAYVVWDDKSAYYLMGGADPDKRNSGATSLVLWEAIQFASTVTNAFDFEGSMIEPVERFFRAFGARPCPYSVLSNVKSPLRLVLRGLRRAAATARANLRETHAHGPND